MKKRYFVGCCMIMIALFIQFGACISGYADEITANESGLTMDCTPWGVSFNENVDSGKLITAQYNADGLLTQLKSYDIENANNFRIPLNDTKDYDNKVKFMLWDDLKNCQPETEVIEKSMVKLSASDYNENKSSADSLYFYLPEKSSVSKKYVLSNDVKCYINGSEREMSIDEIKDLIINSGSAIITLEKDVDSSKYDVVSVIMYATAVVDEVIETEDNLTISFKDYTDGINSRMQLYNNENYSYNFVLGNQKIDPRELKADDVLSICYDVEDKFSNSTFYDVIVSRDTINGKCIAVNELNSTYKIDSINYKTADGMYVDLEIAIYYNIGLDAFGNIAYAYEDASKQNVGILNNIYKSAGGTYIAQILTKDGKKVEYKVDERNAEKYTSQYLKNFNDYGAVYDTKHLKSDLYPQQFIWYKVSETTNKISIMADYSSYEQKDAEYIAADKRIGNLKMSDDTIIFNLTDIDNSDEFQIVTFDNLNDGEAYTAYGYNKSKRDGKYSYVIITDGNVNVEKPEETYVENIGILKNIYKKAGGDYVARILTAKAEEDYKIPYEKVEEYSKLINDNNKAESRIDSYLKQIVHYKVCATSDVITIDKILDTVISLDVINTPEQTVTANYNKELNQIGEMQLPEDGLIVDISDYERATSVNNLIDGNEYTAYRYKTDDNNFSITVITAGELTEDETEDYHDIGILKNIYKQASGDYIAQIITKNGTEEEYKVDSANVTKYQDYFVYKQENGEADYNSTTHRKTDAYPQQVVEYSVNESSNKITINNVCSSVAAIDSKYTESDNNIGSIKMNDSTVMLDLSEVDSKNIYAVVPALNDGYTYTAYGYNKSDLDDTYGFVIITSDTSGIFNSKTQLAIYISSEIVDDKTAYNLIVDGEEKQFILDDDVVITGNNDTTMWDDDFEEGDALVFVTNFEGLISKIYSVFAHKNVLNGSSFESFRNYAFYDQSSILANTKFDKLLSDDNNDVDIVFGPVVNKVDGTITIGTVTRDNNGNCMVSYDDGLEVDYKNAIIYTYDFAVPSKRSRVLLDEGITSTPDMETAKAMIDGKDYINLSHEDVIDNVVFAVVRTVNENEAKEIYLIVNGN